MTSSISHSEKRARRPGAVTLIIVVAAIAGLALGTFYTLRLNPEIRVMKTGARLKQQWAAQLDAKFTNKVVVYGGSSCNFSIDPEHALEKHGRAVANMGLYAALRAQMQVRFALEVARPGDTLIVAVEPPLLESPALGTPDQEARTFVHFAWALGRPAWAAPGQDFAPASIPWKSLFYLPPSGEHLFILLSKIIRRGPLHRYRAQDFTPAGQQFDNAPIKYNGPTFPRTVNGAYLLALKEECARRQLRVAYLLPWQYAPPDVADDLRARHAAFVAEVSKYLTVLEEPALGVYTNRSGVGDYLYHLNRQGARERTDSFLAALQKQELIWK